MATRFIKKFVVTWFSCSKHLNVPNSILTNASVHTHLSVFSASCPGSYYSTIKFHLYGQGLMSNVACNAICSHKSLFFTFVEFTRVYNSLRSHLLIISLPSPDYKLYNEVLREYF